MYAYRYVYASDRESSDVSRSFKMKSSLFFSCISSKRLTDQRRGSGSSPLGCYHEVELEGKGHGILKEDFKVVKIVL